ncbi:hypothetical protein COU15_02585 [Candidatus Kaiserbacteria bacterium CG10_big_fil_rev_8_21_14_0_10_45_20]|uniref:Glycerophosphoryl diester phosphodiesterase membrane domain-containing protein n=1 Tax=Candidatus Kaiserbacteria bacterium CG10_big_fil_rev_8_21_14_0_10_45_20 TaxID=1974607 RepID=A0A2H0UFE1_9BACT|nr:MAG: hypothetical protein COU15_02585 [Candidatus Kaiserbacteria bacterium CG10_big_fil_rev_8_21_14_0_10_45_20]
MKKIHTSDALQEGWKQFAKRPLFLLGLSFSVAILFILAGTSNGLVTALAYIVYGGYLGVLLHHFQGDTISYDDLFSLDSRWISFAFLGLIKGLLLFLGFLLLIVPGVYLSIRWMFAELLVIDQGMKPLQALKASADMTRGHMWELFWFSFVASVLVILGLVFLVVGAVVAALVVAFAMIKIYLDLKNIVTVE